MNAEGMPQVAIDERTYEQGDALQAEIAAFADSIRMGTQPLVGGREGRAALSTAIRIAELVAASSLR
jgi:predicted dehydrogenase